MRHVANLLMNMCCLFHWVPGYRCQLANIAFRIAYKYDPQCKWKGWRSKPETYTLAVSREVADKMKAAYPDEVRDATPEERKEAGWG